ncbi:MAG: type I-C CRISPR-associated protein Cas8c/Csd1 [Rhizobiales bacterium 65-9]|nr:type I-C CRISPR-associated protein Cas8c/Csd1 [Hyphomicrobiales bacterium]OJY32175.1 MAG: type I-C CRISPR-associated protein Cas8c/Csd1 [Rhizobiales bacterium 65-9]
MTILQALDRYYDRMAARGEAEAPGFSREKISFAIELSAAGDPIGVADLRIASGKKLAPQLLAVPAAVKRTVAILPNLFWDKSAYVLGRTAGDGKRTAQEHAAFKEANLAAIGESDDPGLVALKRFLASWTPDRFDAAPFTPDMLDANIVFQLEGERRFIHTRDAAKRIIADDRPDEGEATFCLVSGRAAVTQRLHPTIKGVDGAQSSGAALVSFNLDAFTSHGKEQGDNAPTSEAAAFRYGAALNSMLERSSRNRLKRGVGDATVVFWADTSELVDEREADAAEDFFASLVEPSSDETEAKKIRDRLELLAEGRAVEALSAAGLQSGTRFHILGLSPNAARLAVRFWLTGDFGAFVKRLAEHFEDLRIDPAPWRNPPSVNYLLMRTTALLDKADNIPPLLAGEMMRAVLAGTRYPQTLLAATVGRLRAGDDASSGWHAAAIKAVLARDHRLKRRNKKEADNGQDAIERKDVERKEEKPPVSLERDDPHPAYQLGRLFAAVETAQRMALGKVNATIRDRYFGAASATPATVFPLLMRGVQNHLGKLRKDGKGFWLEREIEEISNRLPPSLPRSLRLEQQGRFVLGYYHQRKGQFADAKANQELTQAEIEIDTGDVDNG